MATEISDETHMSSPRPDASLLTAATRAIAGVEEQLGHLPLHLRIRGLWIIVTDVLIWNPLIRIMGGESCSGGEP